MSLLVFFGGSLLDEGGYVATRTGLDAFTPFRLIFFISAFGPAGFVPICGGCSLSSLSSPARATILKRGTESGRLRASIFEFVSAFAVRGWSYSMVARLDKICIPRKVGSPFNFYHANIE